MGWTRRANPKWKRKAMRQRFPSEVMCGVNYDRHGTVKANNWEYDWTKSRSKMVRYSSRVRRQAAKLQIKFALYEDMMGDIEEYYDDLDWYDDEPMELPDWWYGAEDDYEYPQDDYDYCTDIYDDWYDGHYDYDYGGLHFASSLYEKERYYDDFEHEDHRCYSAEMDRYMNAPIGKTLADIIQDIKESR